MCDGTLMCDTRIEELALLNPVVKLEENKAGSFSFIIPPNHPFYNSIHMRKTTIEVYRDDEQEPIFSGICAEVDGDFSKQKKILCEGVLTFLNDSIQRPAHYKGYTVRGLLEKYIENHNAQVEETKHFRVGIVTVTDSNDYITCYTNMESTMQCLKEDFVDDLGGIIRIRHENGIRYIDYLEESPNTNSQVIKFGKNLLDFTSNFSASDIATAIIPLGAKLGESTVEGLETRLTISSVNDGLDYVYSAEAVEAYGWIYKTIEFDDVTTPEALKSKGWKYLAETQFEDMVINAKAIDLHLTDKDIERFKISDRIRVQSNPHGLNKYFRLTKQTLNLNNPEKDTVTLGKNEKLSLSAKSNQISNRIKKAVESIVQPSSILDQAIANATALITNAMGGYIVKTKDELLIMDTDNIETATKVWRWNINGLGYSSTGYNGKFGLAMTMDGHFVADAITVDGLEVGKNVKMGSNATISWEKVTGTDDVAKKEDIPSDSYITQITKDTVTTSFVNALGITAKSVAAENITGTTLSGKKINGGSIDIGTGNFVVTEDGIVNATGEFTTSRNTETGFIAFSKMVGAGFGVYKHADAETIDNAVLCAQLSGVLGEKSGSLVLRKNGIRDVTIAAGGGRGVQIFDKTNGTSLVATMYRNDEWNSGAIQLFNPSSSEDPFFYVGISNANYKMKFAEWQFSTFGLDDQRLFAGGNIFLQYVNGQRKAYLDQLNVGGSAMTSLAWKWSSELGAFVLTGTQ